MIDNIGYQVSRAVKSVEDAVVEVRETKELHDKAMKVKIDIQTNISISYIVLFLYSRKDLLYVLFSLLLLLFL